MGSTHRTLLCLSAAALAIVAGCGGESAEHSEVAADDTVAAEAAADTAATGRPAITIAHVSNIHPERFPHGAHETVDCTTCHGQIPGHDSHARLACSRCHDSPAGERVRPTAAECNACHHGAAQTRACVDCHGDRPPAERPVVLTADLSVRAGPVSMTLPFDHAQHADRACSACHAQAGVAAPIECTRCHDSHHTAERRCATCHTAVPYEAHDRGAHAGCGGAGCHQDATVTSLEQTRPVCLVCHRQQEDHEPGLECARCHLFSDQQPAGAPWPRPAELLR